MRAALEVVALRNSAPKLTSAHLARIELALIEGDNAQTIEEFEKANRAFHQALVAPCGMPRLLANLDGLQLANSRLVFAMARSAGWRPRSNQDHRLIVQALRTRNVDQACNLLARHIQTIERLALPA
ncbi:FCD domain-containing protein [Bradyrhizobium sacchari]|uniref:FCD domain-containing protein n=2 Tax=Bradyrhizobium sacchari TaxID=1399419 RepID=A0A560J5H9_9BRAD|nr:FCD domain-containing protein [Bradyrhizobium sacchari]TWB80817.1 FCD domain-containing protein [Bradyrhizobium sacchari]